MLVTVLSAELSGTVTFKMVILISINNFVLTNNFNQIKQGFFTFSDSTKVNI